MRRVLIAIVTTGWILAGVTGCFESGSSETATAAPEREVAASTPVAFDLFGAEQDGDEQEVKSAQVEHAVFWGTESGVPEAQPTGIPTSFADLAERVAPAVVSIQTSGTVDLGEQPMLPPGHVHQRKIRHFHGFPRPRRSRRISRTDAPGKTI